MSYEPKRFDFSIPVRINLSSDTQTKPHAAMKEAMMEAEVGDEQMGSDPTVWALCDRTAALLGKEAAVFLPSGTMCNQVAIATHCRPGEEILAHESSHILSSEGGAPAAIAGALIKGLTGERGQFTVDTLEEAIRPVSRYSPTQRLVEVEQTANRGGGACWSVEALHAVTDAAHAHGLSTHMDGARLMNAAVALGVPASDLTEGCDSVWLDFTKGLAAPLGAVLAGSANSSARHGAGSSVSAARCARAASAPQRASTRWNTTSIALPRIMPTRNRWRAAWRRSPASRWRCRRPTWCSSTPRAPA